MFERPKIQYATNDGVSIAYSRFGEGDEVVVYVPPWVSNVELVWDVAEWARALERSARHHQVILFDERGIGLSDRTARPPTVEDRVTDALAVLDAEGVERAHVLGQSGAGPPAIALASRHPERVTSLLLVGSAVPRMPGEEVLGFVTEEDPQFDALAQSLQIVDKWATDDSPIVDYLFPSVAGDERVRAWQQRFERQSASPGAIRAHMRALLEVDVDTDVDRIECPVLIGHSRNDRMMPIAVSRYLAHRLPEATVRYWDAMDHNFVFSPKWAEIQSDLIEFITGVRPAPVDHGRFGVVLFTDIVDSTADALVAGDDRWSQLLDAHDQVAERVITDFGGRRVKRTGDGALALFDDPRAAVDCGRHLLEQLTDIGVQVRAGVHAGQVHLHDDGDISGTAVNIASRVESCGRPGRICVTRTVADLLLGDDFRFEPLGSHAVKGIDQPIELFALTDG